MLKNYSQREILDALERKDMDMYRLLFDEYCPRMVLFAEYFLLDRQEAEDVAQEVFLGLWSRTGMPPVTGNFRSYLFTQVRNRCLNRIKHLDIEDKHRQWLTEAQQYAEILDVEIDEQLMKRVYSAIDELPRQARNIFVMCVVEGKKYREVAEQLGISVNTVNTQMKRAYKYLRNKLGVELLIFLCFVLKDV